MKRSLFVAMVWTLGLGTGRGAVGNLAPSPGTATNQQDAILSNVGFEQKFGALVPPDLVLRDEKGREASLKKYLGGVPAILALVYYECPNLCQLEIQALFQGLSELDPRIREGISAVLVSIDPREGAKLAAGKKLNFLREYPEQDASRIHFLTAEAPTISRLAGAVGFNYVYDEKSGQFAHPSGLVILNAEGHIQRYLFGVEYPGRDLKLALVDSGNAQLGGALDKFLLYCYHYDAKNGTYALMGMRLLRLGGVLTIVLLVGGIYRLSRTRTA